MNPTRIYVVEDQQTNLKLITGILERAGYTVQSSETADEAIPEIIQSPPDLILMDIHLPGTDGLTATRILKANQTTQHIPVIAVTARAMEGDREHILEAGCDEYTAKPIRYKQMLQLIDTVLSRKADDRKK